MDIRKLGLIAIAAVALIALAIAACGDDDDADAQNGDLEGRLTALEEEQMRVGVLATMTNIRMEGLHELDEEINDASEFNAGWAGAAQRLHDVVAGTHWPADLADGGAELEEGLSGLVEAIDSEDLSATKAAVGTAHAAWHELEHSAYAHIAGEETVHMDEGMEHAD